MMSPDCRSEYREISVEVPVAISEYGLPAESRSLRVSNEKLKLLSSNAETNDCR